MSAEFSSLKDVRALANGRIAHGGIEGMRLHVHWFREIGVKGTWAYYECRCGRRRADRYSTLSGPLDWEWLSGAAVSEETPR